MTLSNVGVRWHSSLLNDSYNDKEIEVAHIEAYLLNREIIHGLLNNDAGICICLESTAPKLSPAAVSSSNSGSARATSSLCHMGNMSSAGSCSKQIPTYKEEDYQLAQNICTKLKEKRIKLLAFDFDRTLVTVHTRGAWKQSASKLAEHIRPCLVALIQAAIDNRPDLHVAIVTYSMQPKLIEDVLALVLTNSDDVKQVLIRGNTKDWERMQGISILGKQQHLASCMQEIDRLQSGPGGVAGSLSTGSDQQQESSNTTAASDSSGSVDSDQVLLLDDDIDNVKIAQAFGHRGFEVDDDLTTLASLLEYVNTGL